MPYGPQGRLTEHCGDLQLLQSDMLASICLANGQAFTICA